jgi:hypothetical protein
VEFFLGNLPYEVDASDVAAFIGNVVQPNAAMIVVDRATGRSKGFGGIDVPDFSLIDPKSDEVDGITESTRRQARERHAILQDTEWHGRFIVVKLLRSGGRWQPFLPILNGALGPDSRHVYPDEEQFRDSLGATQGRLLSEDVLAPDALRRVRDELGPITFVDGRVIDFLADHRATLHDLINPRQFEELCYELLRRTGFDDLELTRQSRDDGFDIYGTRLDRGRRNVYVVECKHWSNNNRVGGPVVQQTFGVMGLMQADKAMVVTSSHFTGPAKRWEKASEGRLILRDQDILGAWIRAVRRNDPQCMVWLPGDT